MLLGGVIINKKAVIFEQLEIVKNYIDSRDALNIKSSEFVNDTIKLYASSDKSGEAVAEIALPDETFLDGEKTRLVSDFSWSITEYPKSVDPELDGKTVLVLAVKSRRTVRYSFISLDSILTRLVGGDTESTTVSTDNEVNAMFSTSGYGAGTIGEKNVGDIVKIKENGVDTNYIVVHKGLPSDMYDSSCDGVWLLRELSHSAREWDGIYLRDQGVNDYENSKIQAWLNSEFLNSIDERIRRVIKTVKIPYQKGTGSGGVVQSGANGLSCKIFLLSYWEVENEVWDYIYLSIDGAFLPYFLNDVPNCGTNTKRICKDSRGSAMRWWLRSVYTKNTELAGVVYEKGEIYEKELANLNLVRPAFILPYDVTVNADGLIL